MDVQGEAPTARDRHWTVIITASAGLTAYLVLALLRLRAAPDVDMWLHLRAGDYLREGGRFGLPDPFVVLADRSYRPTQWLAESASSWVWWIGGMPAIQTLRLACVLALVAALWAACRMAGGPVAGAVTTVPATFATAAGWGERPQVLGLVFIAVTVWAWWRALRRARAPWFLVPLVWIWAGVHGTWVLGVGLDLLFVAVALVDGDGQKRPRVVRWLAIPGLSVVAAGLTPLGPANLVDPFAVGLALRGRVNEWQPPEPTNPLLIVIVGMAIVALVLGWRRRHTMRWGRLLLLGAGVVLAGSAVRLLAVGAIVIAPVLAEALGGLRESERPPRLSRPEIVSWGVAAAVVGVVGVWWAITGAHPEPVSRSTSSAMAALPRGTVIAAAPEVMGWTEWAHPDVRLLRDLRSELYEPATATAYDNFLAAQPGWDGYARAHNIEAALLPSDSALPPRLAALGWTERDGGGRYTLWLAPTRQNSGS